MSNEPQSQQTVYSKIGSMIGSAFLVLVPASMVVMLGFVGIAFLGGSGAKAERAEADAPSAPPAAPPTEVADAGDAAEADDASDASAPADAEAEASEYEIDPEFLALGQRTYATCAACHGPDGQGLQAGPLLMAPSLTGAELSIGDPDAAILIVLKGIAKENMDYMGMMAPLGAGLNDEQIAAVLTYTRNAFGNSATPITPEQVADARARFADVDAPAGVKRAEIEEIVKAAGGE